jgi:GNAT superfamily N-acetyltransferase
MLFEKINKDQVVRIKQLAYKTWPDTFKEILSLEQIQYMLNWMYNEEKLAEQISNGHEFYIIHDEQDLGFIGVEFDHPERGIMKIHKLYVLPDQQGKALGYQLFNFVKQRAIEKGISRIQLNVNRFNKAVAFYDRVGFKIIKEEDIDIGEGYLMEDYVMEYLI